MTDRTGLIEAFGKVAGILGTLATDEERKRVIAAIICLLDDDHAMARAVVAKHYAAREK